MDVLFVVIALIGAAIAGVFGSLLGLGGGIIIVPVLTIGLKVDIKTAIGASIVAVIATSSAAATVYVHERITNIKLGMILETATTIGAIVGALIVVYVNKQILAAAFGMVLIYAAFYMTLKLENTISGSSSEKDNGKAKDNLRLSGRYYDKTIDKTVEYKVKNLQRGLVASYAAGNLSGMLGIGGGIVKVPAMNVWMKVPMKAAVATSNFMIGVTGVASAYIYYANGLISPVITAIVAVGVFLGASFGSRIANRIRTEMIRKAFIVVVSIMAVTMFLRALGFYMFS